MNERVKNIVVTVLSALVLFGLSFTCMFFPGEAYSESERRVLAEFPEISTENLLSGKFMSDFEKYSADRFPMRDSFRTIKALFTLYGLGHLDNNDIYIVDGYLSKLDPKVSTAMLDHSVERFNNLYNLYMADKDMKIYFSAVPDKNYFLAEKLGYPAAEFSEVAEYVSSGFSVAEYIDISGLLALEDYYKTDSHWKQPNITDVASAIAEAMGSSIGGNYKEITLDSPFYGVYYGQSALPVKPDEIKYLTSDIIDSLKVTSYDTGMPKEIPVYDMEAAVGRDPYEMFVGGADALLVIENPNCKNGRELIIFRDSFGSSIVPLLAEGYEKVTVVDIRYVQSAFVGNFVTFEDQDVLFLYSSSILNNSLALG